MRAAGGRTADGPLLLVAAVIVAVLLWRGRARQRRRADPSAQARDEALAERFERYAG